MNKSVGFVAAVTVSLTAAVNVHADLCEVDRHYPSSPESLENYGASVGISGDVAIVGSPRRDVSGMTDRGAVQFYFRTGGVWTPSAFSSPNTLTPDAEFGRCVGISGNSAVVGAPFANTTEGDASGRAYIYENVGGLWLPTVSVLPTDIHAFAFFGYEIAIHGDTIVFGIGNSSVPGNPYNSGAIMIYDRSSGQWAQKTGRIVGPTPMEGDYYGTSVAVSDPAGHSNGLIAFGGTGVDYDGWVDSGAVRVYKQYTGGDGLPVWTYTNTVGAPSNLQQMNSRFGEKVAIRADSNGNGVMAVAATYQDNGAIDNGLVFIYRLINGTWSFWGTISGSTGNYSHFGQALDIEGNSLIVGERSSYVWRFRIDTSAATFEQGVTGVGGYMDSSNHDNGLSDSVDQSNGTLIFADEDYYIDGWQTGSVAFVDMPSNSKLASNSAEGATRINVSTPHLVQCMTGYTNSGDTSTCAASDTWLTNDGWFKVEVSPTTPQGRYEFWKDAGGNQLAISVYDAPPSAGGVEIDCGYGGVEFDLGASPVYLRVAGYTGGELGEVGLNLAAAVACPADLNGTGAVDFNDLLIVLQNWGTTGADIDEDGVTGFNDLLQLLSAWGPCP